MTDSFLVEGGDVVVTDPIDPEFRASTGSAFLFQVVVVDDVRPRPGR